MNYRQSRFSLILFCSLVSLSFSICHGQTYQGPSGGHGGQSFDHWKQSGELRDIAAVSLLIENSAIRCIRVQYRGPSQVVTQSGHCNPPRDDRKDFYGYGWTGITLNPGEFIIGIAGRYGARIDSLRFYTNQKSPPAFGGAGGAVDFGYTAPSGQKIVAFIGRAGDSLDAIGVMFGPIAN